MSIRKYNTAKGETRYAVNVYNKYLGKTQWVGTFKTAEEAKRAFSRADSAIRDGLPRFERKDTGLSDCVDRWQSVRTVNTRQNTRKDYEYAARYLKGFFKNKPMSTIDIRQAEDFAAWLSRKELSANYIRKIFTRLSQVRRYARSLGYTVPEFATKDVGNLPAAPHKKIRPLKPAEIRALIEAIPSYWQPVVRVMVTGGLRRSEAFGLTRENVDLDNGLIHVTHQLVRGKLVPPKTDSGTRWVPLNPSTVEAIRRHLDVVPESDLNLVFPTELGRPVNYSNWRNRVWRPAVEKSGLRDDLTIHDLRRTAASAMARQRRSPGYLQAVMGHQKATTTLTYYTGLYEDERQTAVSDMEEWLAQETRVSARPASSSVTVLKSLRNTTCGEDDAA
jgi:integrase